MSERSEGTTFIFVGEANQYADIKFSKSNDVPQAETNDTEQAAANEPEKAEDNGVQLAKRTQEAGGFRSILECPPRTLTVPTCGPTCPDCLFQQSHWRTNPENTEYRATKENCGTILVNLTANSLSIMEDGNDGNDGEQDVTDFSKAIPGMNFITLNWEVDKTKRDNETIRVVFSDSGDEYAGCGDFDGAFFKTKPSGEAKRQYTLWTSKDNPTYLPFYISRKNQDNSICMFADAQGAPIEITVTETTTEWLIYRVDEVKFYFYTGNSLQDVLNECIGKWNEIYPASEASWTDDLIIGSLTAAQVKADQDRGTSIASHYILSPDVVSMTNLSSYELVIEDGGNITDYSNIILPLKTRQTITTDSGITRTPENGYYLSDADDNYILDFENSNIQSGFDDYLSGTQTGFLLQGGFRLDPTSDQCSKYFHCSDPQFENDANVCLSADFGESRVFEKHNFYDISRKKTLQPQNIPQHWVIETLATPGTTHFHRTNLELTEAGLKTCYHNIFNLRRLGIGAVTCNICAGVVPSTEDEKSLCFRWSQLAFLMPYVIISSVDDDLTVALSNGGGFTKMKENIALRKQLYFYLADSWPVLQEKSNGVVIGESLFMVVNLEGSSEVDVQFPAGEWLAPAEQSEGTYRFSDDDPPQKLTFEEDITKLIFYQLDNIFVLKDDENKVEVHIFQLKEGYIGSEITSTFTYNEHKTVIKLDQTNKKVNFAYTPGSTEIDTDKFRVSKLLIYYWTEDARSNPTKTTYRVGDNKYNVVFNYLEGNDVELKSVFQDWNQIIPNSGGS